MSNKIVSEKKTSLAVEFRPKNFLTLTGQKHVSTVIRRAIETSQIPRQLLFSGSSGLGKTTIARITAAAILCQTPLSERDKADACLSCQSCLDIIDVSRIHPDVIEFDAASNGGKEEIKDIAAKASLVPLRSEYKIYIIDEAHGLSGPGGQAFLKLLEEPPGHVIFMLATTDPEKMLKTNRSRCIEFELLRPTDKEMIDNLLRVCKVKNWPLSEEQAKKIINSTDPDLGVRGTLMTLEKLSGALSLNETIDDETFDSILGLVPSDIFKTLTSAVENGNLIEVFKNLEILRTKVSDTLVRNDLISWARENMLSSLENEQDSKYPGWVYSKIVKTPQGKNWTDVLLVELTEHKTSLDLNVLEKRIKQAQDQLNELEQKLSSSKADRAPILQKIEIPPKATSAKDPTEDETEKEPYVETPQPEIKTTNQSEVVPREKSSASLKTDANNLDGHKKLFLSALGASSPEMLEFVSKVKMDVSSERILISVPNDLKRKANELYPLLKKASSKLNIPLSFSSI